ncbi:SDR family oxidoreductase [Candidatus Woesearchaeota archaeon]|nr:SDR family oxidoreductase [Candidatus Woesearchaeota archaeon]
MDLKNKIVLITGSSIGIGRETAFKFAKEGCKVVITYYKDKKEGEEAAKKCLDFGASGILVLQLNVMDNKSIKDAVKKIIDMFKKIDILINNAGIVVWKPFKEHTFEDIENEVRTNLEGLMKMTRECLPYIDEAIINISSGAGKEAYSGLSAYCATKFGVRGFTQSIATELRNIRVYSVNPGTTATRMNNFCGTPPEKVADIVLRVAKGELKADSSKDIDVWELV